MADNITTITDQPIIKIIDDGSNLTVQAVNSTSTVNVVSTGGSVSMGGTTVNGISDVPGLTAALAGKEPTITAGTLLQYLRGDKSWQTLDKSAVGLGNVDNTSDLNKPLSNAATSALSLKANLNGAAFTGAISATNLSGTNTGDQDLSALATITALNTGLAAKQANSADLTAIAGQAGNSGFLKKTGAGTWTLDTNSYQVAGSYQPAGNYQPLDNDLTAIAALTTTGFLKRTGVDTWALDTTTYQPAGSYLTANQSITLSGDITGSGSTAITTALGVNTVTLAKMAQVATGTFLGRTSAATGNVEAMTVAQAKALLNLTGTNSGDQDLSGYALTTALTSGLAGKQANSTDLTSIAGLAGTTGFLKKSGAGTYVLDTTAYQAAGSYQPAGTYATGTGTASGTNTGDETYSTITSKLAGGSGGGTVNFLRADGTFAAPPGTGGSSSGMAWAPVTGTGTGASQTLTIPESGLSASDIMVFVNGVLQRPTTDYTLSGTTVTLTTLNSGDPIAIIKPAGGSVTGAGGGGTWGSITGTLSSQADLWSALNAKQANSADLTSIASLAGTTGLLKKTAAGTYVLDTTSYQASGNYATGGGTATGTNTGDQTITLSGAISGSGTGAITTTLGAGAVALSNMANVATGTIFYRKTAATGAPEVQTLATLKSDLGLTGTNTGDQTTITGNAGSATVLQTARLINGTSFNGSADITITAATANAVTFNNSGAGAATGSTFTGSAPLTISYNTIGAQVAGSYAAAVHTHSVSDVVGVPTGTLFYRKTAGSGAAETQTLATLKSDLGLSGTNTGDQDLSGYATTSALTSGLAGKQASSTDLTSIAGLAGTTGFLKKTAAGTYTLDTTAYQAAGTYATGTGSASGTNTGDQTITLTGDITGSGTGSFATAIGANKVTDAMLAQIATGSFKGRTSAGTGNVEVLTGTQATAMLDLANGTTKGLMSSSDFTKLAGVASGATNDTYATITSKLAAGSGGGTTNFLRADGTFAAPPAGGGGGTWGSITGTLSSQTDLQNALNAKQASSADLTSIAGLAGTTGFLKKTAAGTYTLDTTSYQASGTYATGTGSASGTNTGDETYSTITSKLAGGSGGGTTNFLRADGTFAAPPAGGGSGTVTSFAFTNGAGVTGTVTNASTTPTLALTLGAITPTSVAASGTITASNKFDGWTFNVGGKTTASERFVLGIAQYALTVSGTNTVAKSLVAATASTVFTIKKGTVASPTTIGTITFAASATSGTVSISAGAVASGDIVWIEAPATPDSSLADIAFVVRA